ncbi:MAG TPA: SDR family NAD(P)-dependent oxidoreductase [Myxococcota bacterium]|jgi:NADP-dependent 3-hydroxy acid dehydrogenase YdfG
MTAHRALEGRVAYVTGASSGIGAAIAVALAHEGASLVLGARRADRLAEVAARCSHEGAPRVHTGIVDVTDDKAVDAWLAAAPWPCDILVNNAGKALGRGRVDDADTALWDEMLDVNVRAAFWMARKVVPGIVAGAKSGRPGDVVMMSSVAAFEPYANGSVYAASKAALHAFSRALRAELLGLDVRVLSFEPGMVETEFSLVRFAGDADAAKKVYAGMRPVTPDEVAECVLFSLTRKRHVSLDHMMILSTDQLGTQSTYRR